MTLADLSIELSTAYTDKGKASHRATSGDLLRIRQAIASLMPFHMDYPDKAACIRQARIAFVSYLLERSIRTTAEMSRGEAWRIAAWLDGRHPFTYTPEDDQEEARLKRQEEVARWLTANEKRIKRRAVMRPSRRQKRAKTNALAHI
jgi:hypothetical protein